jgi:hypothetical protein
VSKQYVKNRDLADGSVGIWLACDNLTPDPSPARNIGKKPQILMAGEGSLKERGLRPLSNSLPPSFVKGRGSGGWIS